jgi:hypothetical protein
VSFAAAIEHAKAGAATIGESGQIYDFAGHNQTLLAGVDHLQRALVRTDAAGKEHDTTRADRLGIGSVPRVIDALLYSLEAAFSPLASLTIPDDWQADVDNWTAQIATYRERLLEAGQAAHANAELGGQPSFEVWLLTPNAELWRGITLPLVQGWYYMPVQGVVVPAEGLPVQRPPGIVRPSSATWAAIWSLGNVSQTQKRLAGWSGAWTDAGNTLSNAFEALRDAIKEHIIEPAKTAGRWGIAAVIAGVFVGVVLLVSGGKR